MVSKQIDFDGNIVKDVKDIKEIVDVKDLLYSLIDAEKEYKLKKFYNALDFDEQMLTTDWDTINEERKEKGLPKLSNQDMKKAHIKYMMMVDYDEELYLELEYLRLSKMYDVAMKMGFEMIK
ncbi:MAG: hypothetical protein J6Y78_11205 [Paludibacteraceae bacterium]|nr:hypothetical protein [Paludibacteraceae bacterium]